MANTPDCPNPRCESWGCAKHDATTPEQPNDVVERAYREGWRDGNNAGHSGKCGGVDDDWRWSDGCEALQSALSSGAKG